MAELIGVREVCSALRCDRSTLYRWRCAAGMAFPRPRQVGGKVLWERAEVERWLQSRPRVVVAQPPQEVA